MVVTMRVKNTRKYTVEGSQWHFFLNITLTTILKTLILRSQRQPFSIHVYIAWSSSDIFKLRQQLRSFTDGKIFSLKLWYQIIVKKKKHRMSSKSVRGMMKACYQWHIDTTLVDLANQWDRYSISQQNRWIFTRWNFCCYRLKEKSCDADDLKRHLMCIWTKVTQATVWPVAKSWLH